MEEKMNVSSNPHIRSKISTQHIMLSVVIALLPACGYGVYHFGLRALFVLLLSLGSCIIAELLFNIITKRSNSLTDFSAYITGLLLGMNLPVSVPWWLPVIGGFFAIIVVKMLFGGLGQNFMNPALGARCFLLISFPKLMTDFSVKADAVSSATPLAALKNGETVSLKKMFIGDTLGTIGETSAIAIMIGGIALILIGVIDYCVTFSYIASFALFIIAFGGNGLDMEFLAAHLLGGGLMLGAFFMATDYVTRPITKKGQLIYGLFLGFLTAIFRIYGPSAEGVSYAIIIGNLIVPLIDRISMPKAFGKRGKA